MVKDYQEHVEQQASPSAAGTGGGSVLRGVKFKLAALALAGITFSAATGFLMVQFHRDPGSPPLAGASLAAEHQQRPAGSRPDRNSSTFATGRNPTSFWFFRRSNTATCRSAAAAVPREAAWCAGST